MKYLFVVEGMLIAKELCVVRGGQKENGLCEVEGML